MKHLIRTLGALASGLVALLATTLMSGTAFAWSDPGRPQSTRTAPAADLTPATPPAASTWPVTVIVVSAVIVALVALAAVLFTRKRSAEIQHSKPRTPALGV